MFGKKIVLTRICLTPKITPILYFPNPGNKSVHKNCPAQKTDRLYKIFILLNQVFMPCL